MKRKLKTISIRLSKVVRENPVEVFLSALFFVIGCYCYESKDRSLEFAIRYFPVIFLFSYTLNRLIIPKLGRWFYYVSALSFLPFLLVEGESHFLTYLVSLIVIQLFYLIGCGKKDNNDFMQAGLCYVGALLSALLLAVVAWLLSLSIYYSIRYIFEIWQGGESDFITYTACFIYIGIMPILFLMFNRDGEGVYANNKLFNVLMNYVLTPALLIYAFILYLYFIKIAVQWSLPKGAVAYIVVSFSLATFVLKGCQAFLVKRYYDWFFRRSSLIVLPTLVMYWIGSLYRINEYGFTELRVYLVVVGLILTGIAVMFLSKRFGHYLYAVYLAALLLSSVTYIPGITALDIERISQASRGNYPIKDEVATVYFDLINEKEIHLAGYSTVRLVESYETSGVWRDMRHDTFYLYEGEGRLLFKEQIDSLLARQFAKAGLSLSDTIPDTYDPALFEIELDSAKLVFQRFSLSRDTLSHVSYLEPAFYLKK